MCVGELRPQTDRFAVGCDRSVRIVRIGAEVSHPVPCHFAVWPERKEGIRDGLRSFVVSDVPDRVSALEVIESPGARRIQHCSLEVLRGPGKGSFFRVLPDVKNNRLLLWASEDELKEVRNLISMLSQNSDGTFGDNRKVRRLDSRSSENIERLLEQLKATWPGANDLEIQVQPAPEKKPADQQQEPDKSNVDKLTDSSPRRYWLTQAAGEPAAVEPDRGGSPPPIKITINSEGQIIIASEDTAALDQLQDLIEQLSPSRPEYHYFKLRYISAFDVVINLEKYFEDDLKEEDDDSYWSRYQPKAAPAPMTLGKRPPLRFIDDDITNTVIVANASSSQLKTITEIIKMYDQPPVKEDYLPRKTEVIPVKYSRAADIAVSLKDVYRDLLSSKDKAFQDKEGKQTSIGRSRGYVFEDVKKQ